MNLEEACSRLRALLEEAVSISPAQGVLLSGGLDTSIIALLARRRVKGIKVFTVSLEGYDLDLSYARQVADFLGVEHRVHLFSEQEWLEAAMEAKSICNSEQYRQAALPFIQSQQREGMAEPPGLATLAPAYIAMRFARQHVDSVYVGDGADELFLGYGSIIGFIDLIASTKSDDGPFDSSFNEDFARNLWATLCQACDLSFPFKLGKALGLEVRAPFLAPEVVDWARTLPLKYKVRSEKGKLWGKWILRKAFQGYLPPEIVWRDKTTIDSGTGSRGVLLSRIANRVRR